MEYTLIRSKRKSLAIQIKNGEVIVRAPLLLSKAKIEKFIALKQNWINNALAKQKEQLKNAKSISQEKIKELKEVAKTVLPEKAEFFAGIIGVEYKNITIRKQKSRWGSCSSKGNLNFNCLLMLFPNEIIDYVVVHELCHLKHMNHLPRFWAEVEKVLPDYKQRRSYLKKQDILLK